MVSSDFRHTFNRMGIGGSGPSRRRGGWVAVSLSLLSVASMAGEIVEHPPVDLQIDFPSVFLIPQVDPVREVPETSDVERSFNQGVGLLKQGKIDEADGVFKQFYASHLNSPLAARGMLLLGEAKLQVGFAAGEETRLADALRCFDQARAVPDFSVAEAINAYINIALIRVHQKNYVEAASGLLYAAGHYAEHDESARLLLTAAEIYLQQKMPDRTRELLLKYSLSHPFDRHIPIYKTMLAEVYYQLGDFAQVVKIFTRLNSGYPSVAAKSPRYILFAEGLLRTQRYDEARQIFEDIYAQLTPETGFRYLENVRSMVLAKIGDTSFLAGDWKVAEKIYLDTVKKYPGTRGQQLAGLRLVEMQAITSIQDFENVLAKLDVMSANKSLGDIADLATYTRGIFLFRNGDHHQAVATLYNFIQQTSRSPYRSQAEETASIIFRLNLERRIQRRAFFEMATWNEAHSYFYKKMDDRNLLKIVGDTYRELGWDKRAEAAYRKSLSLAPVDSDSWRMYLALADLLIEMGRVDDAKAMISRSQQVVTQPTLAMHATILQLQAEVAYRGHQTDHVGALLAEAVALDPKTPERATAYRLLGQMAMGEANPGLAMEQFELALELTKKMALAYQAREERSFALYGRASALFSLNLYREAAAAYGIALKEFPDHPAARIGKTKLAEALSKTNRSPQSEDVLASLVPEDDVWGRYARWASEQKRWEEQLKRRPQQ